jgi:HEPN domain-containing protein
MKTETSEWIDKAEGDLKVALSEIQAADAVYNVICFLAQQCAEKYLKAFLEEQNTTFRKTHDLLLLLNLSGGMIAELDAHREGLARLSAFGIAARYPGAQADQQAAEDSIKIAGEVRLIVRSKLGL